MEHSLYRKVWERNRVATLPGGRTQLFVDVHLIHEVTSPQAFAMLEERGLQVAMPERTFATHDHVVPTDSALRPLSDAAAESMLSALTRRAHEHGVRLFDVGSGDQGIVHVIGPELGLIQPGTVAVCGDSHTATLGAFGVIAMGIGTSQVRDVLASQSLTVAPLKLRRVRIDGPLPRGVTAKDVALHMVRVIGPGGSDGYAHEYVGSTVEAMDMEARMTLCNLSIEAGARVGYVNPDEVTFDYLRGRRYAPRGEAWARAVTEWRTFASDADAACDDEIVLDASAIAPTVSWGIHPSQAIAIDERVPDGPQDALSHMGLEPGQPLAGVAIDVAFLGSCTNGRLGDFHAAAEQLDGRSIAPGVRAFAVPGSAEVARQAEADGTAERLRRAGFEWRLPGCSFCLGMNPDRLVGRQVCASTSNRNFKGRQGSPEGRTLLMSPRTLAESAVRGVVADPRERRAERRAG